MRHLIVDGYNVIHQTPPYQDLAGVDLESARAALISDIAAFAQSEWQSTVVFDGHANPESDGCPHEVCGVRVIFSPFGTDADAVIEGLARAIRESGQEALVITSDAQTQWTVMGGRVTRRSSAEFGSDLRDSDSEWREHVPAGERRIPLDARIDPAVAQILTRWARGEG